MASTSLSSIDLSHLGLQEMMRQYWLDIKGLGLVSMLSVSTRQSVSDGRFWRAAVRAMFPRHPFEVNRLMLGDVVINLVRTIHEMTATSQGSTRVDRVSQR